VGDLMVLREAIALARRGVAPDAPSRASSVSQGA
jgi:hypothetical protein